MKGCLVECPKHNGRFDVRDGSPQRPPVCVPLVTYPVRCEWATLSINVRKPDSQGDRPQEVAHRCRVVSATQVATFILATNPAADSVLRFTVRIATPSRGQDCLAGVGSSYVWSLAPGHTVELFGPYGDFLIKDTDAEMIYLGGGAGMAPLRSHLSYLFDTLATGRRVSFWYGARSRQKLFYLDVFQDVTRRFPNFRFETALSKPLAGDRWTGHVGFIHDVLARE
ncbi:MAG: hypothetical protein WD060_05540 [Pirellulales bacterium]